MLQSRFLTGTLAVFLLSPLPSRAADDAAAAVDFSALLQQRLGVEPRDMMQQYLFARVEEARQRWRKDYEARRTPEAIQAYQKRLRERFVEALGGFPERTPLHPRIVGTVERKGYGVEKVIFESQPRHFVTAALFLPDPVRHAPPWPGVLVPCGHSANGKALDVYQRVCALAAVNGLAAFIFDPIQQGERHQALDEKGEPRLAGTAGHNMIGIGSILLGRNTARFEIWDGIRALDYLASRPEIDATRLGCTGNSGGGTQTCYLMALDDRVAVAAPSCYVCGLFGRLLKTNGAQDAEQNIFGQLAFGMDHADYCMMRAPRPTLLCTATGDFFNIEDAWESFRMAKRLYTRLGYPERMALVETDAPHGFSPRLREGAVRWMARWLLGRDEPIFEPEDLQILTEEEIRCAPEGKVMLLEEARSVYDLNRDFEVELARRRAALWSENPRTEMLDRVRAIAGVRTARKPGIVTVEKVGTQSRDDLSIDRWLLSPEEGIFLPALAFRSTTSPSGPPVLYLHAEGKDADAAPGGPIEKLARSGHVVLSVDLRGTGDTQQIGQRYFNPTLHGSDGQDFYVAYLLGRSYVGMRTEDALACAAWLRGQSWAGAAESVRLVAVGHAGIPALHAAALEPTLFDRVKLVGTLVSWSSVVELGYTRTPLTSLVHGALEVYDLPDLVAALGDRITLTDPVDALGRSLE